MAKFNITLTMGDGHVEKLALTKSQLAHIFTGPYSSIYKPKISNDDLETAVSIIKLGIGDYANAYTNVKHCTIVDRYNGITTEYDFNTDVTDISNNYGISLYYYILDASIEYNFSIVKAKLLHQYRLYIKDGIDLVDINKLNLILRAIIARLDMAYYNKKFYIIIDEDNYKIPFEKDDIFEICDCIAHKKDDIMWFKADERLNRILSYFDGIYEPHYTDLHEALNAYIQYFDD